MHIVSVTLKKQHSIEM